jgi:hypothetical protein
MIEIVADVRNPDPAVRSPVGNVVLRHDFPTEHIPVRFDQVGLDREARHVGFNRIL